MKLHNLTIILFLLISNSSFSQSSKLEKKEIELIKLYNKLYPESANNDIDSTLYYSKKVEENFIALIKNNPESINYTFRKLLAKNTCYINTSADGNFRIYSWDDGTGGTMRYFKSIIQWRNNDKIFSKVVEEEDTNGGNFCSKIYSLKIQSNITYFAISNSIQTSKDVVQMIQAYRITGNKLTSPKVFKTKNKMLNYIDLYFDFFSVVDRPERPLQLITYNTNKQSIFIPLVNYKGTVKNRALVYKLKSNGYFEYTGVENFKYN